MKAIGQLQHHFWGEYSCSIGLQFSCPEAAESALQLLPNWKQGTKNKDMLVAFLSNEQLSQFQAQCERWHLEIAPCGRKDCKHQCRNAGIDSINHSIDYGPVFTIDIPAEHINQSLLPLATLVTC